MFEHNPALMHGGMALPAGQLTKDKLPDPLFERLAAVWPVNHPIGILRNQKLWALLIGMGAINMRLAPGVELVLTARAKVDRRPISFLETGQEFIASADRIEDSRYIRLLELSLDTLSQSPQRVQDMYAAWISENLHAFEILLSQSPLAAEPVVRNAVIEQRTLRWMPTILELLQSPHRTLLAVGALHLPGPDGLLAHLEQAGHQLHPVTGP